ncbi:hypothetical protein TARUN_10054, partial [Trichoderma arundinaceum]
FVARGNAANTEREVDRTSRAGCWLLAAGAVSGATAPKLRLQLPNLTWSYSTILWCPKGGLRQYCKRDHKYMYPGKESDEMGLKSVFDIAKMANSGSTFSSTKQICLQCCTAIFIFLCTRQPAPSAAAHPPWPPNHKLRSTLGGDPGTALYWYMYGAASMHTPHSSCAVDWRLRTGSALSTAIASLHYQAIDGRGNGNATL